MWDVTHESCSTDIFGLFRPKEVLTRYDGDRAFTFTGKDGKRFLAYWCDDFPDINVDRFIVVPCDAQTLVDLRQGNIPIRTALGQPDIWIVDTVVNTVDKIWKISSLQAIPMNYLPDSNVRFEPPSKKSQIG